ncbi:MAG: trans-4-hydroxy-L-proline dehydratase [Candidatus Hodarchaeales archaeon]
MTDRIKKLREQSVEAKPFLSHERAKILTDFYKSGQFERHSIPVGRALALKNLFESKTIYIGDNELIVGEKGEAPVATPTFPEICIHSLKDLEILNNREKISFTVSEETRRVYESEIIPFWNGKSIRDKIFNEVDKEWVDAYEAGIFTEFMEQRSPGHTVAGKNVFQKGLLDLKEEIGQSISKIDFYNDPDALDKREELQAMVIFADGLILYARRHADKAIELARKETNLKRKKELEKIAEICDHVPAHSPRTFWEAVQHYWFIHLGVTTELNTWDSFCPGRVDQHLYPFYRNDLDKGELNQEEMKEILQAWWIKFNNQPAPPKVGVTAEESNTYTDFCNINFGGVKDDGSHGINELTYLFMDVIEEMRLLQPSTNVQISKKTPDRFIKRVLKILKTGFGQPSIFNADSIISELTRQGKDIIDARRGGASGCVESGAFGTEAYILTGYFNLPKILEITLQNGQDPRTQNQLGIKTGKISNFKTFDDLFSAFKKQLNYFIDIKIKGNVVIERLWAKNLPDLCLSLFTDDCIKIGKDYHNGGARYNTSYIQGVGIGTITDALTAIKYHVYDKGTFSFEELMLALKNNFEGNQYEDLRNFLINKTPKYGNDIDYADSIMQEVFEAYFSLVDGKPNTRGGVHRVNMLPTTCHVYFGSVIGATPDGRLKSSPLSEGISPVQGMDMKGPTAVLKSAGKMDHLKTGGTLLNQKFTPDLLSDTTGIDKITQMVRTYFRMDGHHIQFNVISAGTLREAQQDPEKFRNLIVRVAGYSDYFINLGKDLQDEIIARTEHSEF